MTRIAIAGAAGRMGRNLVIACSQTDDMELTQAIEREQSPSIGSDTGLLAGLAPNSVLINDHLDASTFDILIDFTIPARPPIILIFASNTAGKWSLAPPGVTRTSNRKCRRQGRVLRLYTPLT